MKIKCPVCGTENYFSGIEDEDDTICSNCGEPLFKIGKEKSDNMFPESKKILLDEETLSDLLTSWVVTNINIIKKHGIYKDFLKKTKELLTGTITEEKFLKEAIYLYMWLVHMNCHSAFHNKDKVDICFFLFSEKVYEIFFKKDSGRHEEWVKTFSKKLNGYITAYNLFVEGDSYFKQSSLGTEFGKNIYGMREDMLGATETLVFTAFVAGELTTSFKTLGKVLMKYKI